MGGNENQKEREKRMSIYVDSEELKLKIKELAKEMCDDIESDGFDLVDFTVSIIEIINNIPGVVNVGGENCAKEE